MTYRALSLPLPVRNYRAEMVLVSDDNGNGCTVHWDSWFGGHHSSHRRDVSSVHVLMGGQVSRWDRRGG